MNETKPAATEKGLDDKRKNAMLRYIGIMFVVAFLFVLVSMLGELRTSEVTISELNQSSTSAIHKAEQLQDNNRQLEKDNAYLTGRIDELEKQIADLELELAVSQEKVQQQKDQLQETEARISLTEEEAALRATAYELLLQAAQDPSVLPEVEAYAHYFDAFGYQFYENLKTKGEETND